jgi:hypothetical protein
MTVLAAKWRLSPHISGSRVETRHYEWVRTSHMRKPYLRRYGLAIYESCVTLRGCASTRSFADCKTLRGFDAIDVSKVTNTAGHAQAGCLARGHSGFAVISEQWPKPRFESAAAMAQHMDVWPNG